MEGLKQFRTSYIYIYKWKCQDETVCIDILSRNIFFNLKNGGQKCKLCPIWRLVAVGAGRIQGLGKGG
jgi:hypothetical protein